MSGPWEQYQQPPAAAPPPAAVGPWSQYQQAAPTQAPADAPATATTAPKTHWYDTATKELGDLNTGFTHGLSQTGATAEKALTHVPIVGKLLAQNENFQKSQADDQARADESMDTGGKVAGNVIENILEFAGGDEALKGASLSVKLAKLAPLAKVMENSPRLARVLGEAIRQGAVGGAQAAGHGGDAKDVAEGALAGGAGAAVFAGLPEGVAAMAERVKPGTADIAGAAVPVMSKTAAGAEAALSPDVQAAQQAGAKQALTNLAQKATADSLERVNATRPQPVSDPARMLPAPEGEVKPYQFQMDTPEPEETPQTTPLGSRTIPGDPAERFSGDPRMAKSEWQYNPPESGQQAISNGRGATMTTSDPAVAHATLARMDDVIESPAFDQLGPRQQAKVQASAEALRSQIAEEGAYRARMSHFAPIDSAAAASKVGSFADAAAQIEGGVSDVYSKLDDVSDGKWGQLRKSEQQAVRMTRNATSPEAADSADARLLDIRKQMQGVFEANREQIHPAEWRAANSAWKDASTLKDIHATLERSFNGVPEDVAGATGIDRTLKGGNKLNKGLQKLLDKRGDDVRRVIGQDGVNNLYRVSQLLTDQTAGPRTKGVLQAVGAVTRHHGIHLGAGALIGGGLGEIAGRVAHVPFGGYQGALAGVATEAAVRRALSRAATNPAIAERLSYAAKNNVSHRVAAPLLATMMLNPPQQQQPPADPQPQP